VELPVKKFLKWTGFVVAGLAGVAALGIAYLNFASERERLMSPIALPRFAVLTPEETVAICEFLQSRG
jgi:hypothetical protein